MGFFLLGSVFILHDMVKTNRIGLTEANASIHDLGILISMEAEVLDGLSLFHKKKMTIGKVKAKK